MARQLAIEEGDTVCVRSRAGEVVLPRRSPRRSALTVSSYLTVCEGPIDDRTRRLIKLGIAMGAMREGAVHSSARKALGLGITTAELHQVVALAASLIGLPSTVAVWTWVRDVEKVGPSNKGRGKRK